VVGLGRAGCGGVGLRRVARAVCDLVMACTASCVGVLDGGGKGTAVRWTTV